MTTIPHRRWIRFSLRTLFVVVTLVALAMYWLVWQMRIQERKAILRAIMQSGSFAKHDYVRIEYDDSDAFQIAPGQCEYARVSAIRRFFGDESCIELRIPPTLGGEWIKRAENAFPEARLFTNVYDDDGVYHPQFRDSLYAPAADRRANLGTVFKTGLK